MDYVEIALKDLEAMFRDLDIRDEMIGRISKAGGSLRKYVKLEVLQGDKITEHVSVPYNTGLENILGGDIEVSIFHIPETIRIVSLFTNIDSLSISAEYVHTLPRDTVFKLYFKPLVRMRQNYEINIRL